MGLSDHIRSYTAGSFCRLGVAHPSELVVGADAEVQDVAVGVGGGYEQPARRPAGVKQTAVALALDLRRRAVW